MTKKLVLIDGNSILYRAFYALPLLHNDQGVHTNAVYGFTTMLMRILEEEKPTHLLIAFDAGKTTFRHESYKEYKGGRDKTPDELREQFPLVKQLIESFDIKHYELDLYEADDIIGTFAKKAEKENMKTTVITGDRDMLQLVSPKTTVQLTRRGITNVDKYTPTMLEEKLLIKPEQVIDYKALKGDPSDNIPGVPGIGEKTAQRLLNQFASLDEVYKNLDEVSGKKLKENLTNYKEDAYLSQQLVTIKCDTPVEIQLSDVEFSGYDDERVINIFKSFGFDSLVKRLGGKIEEKEIKPIEYEVVEEVTSDLFGEKTALVVEVLKDNYHNEPIEGIGISSEVGNFFLPTELALQSDVFQKWAADETKKKLLFDSKKAIVSLHKRDIKLKGICFDLLIAAYLVNPGDRSLDIPTIAHRYDIYDIKKDEEVYGKGARLKVPEEKQLAEHVVRKAHTIATLKDKLKEQLKENEQYDLFTKLEMPLTLILAEMEYTGIRVDIQRLKEMGEQLNSRLETIKEEVHELAGESFNLNSPKQLGTILFEKLNLRVIRKTKTGYSTAADVLEKLKNDHPIISKILLYRQLDKLYSTYIEGLLKVVDSETEKVHTRFNQALTQTGRLSSTEPNLQNIPVRLEEGRKIRQAFIPDGDDWVIFAADYSQIELRVLAHISKDQNLIEAFENDLDIHTDTASNVFHVPIEEVTEEMREQAKAVNFGIVYGISDYGLSQNLGITRKEAKTFIDKYFEVYPGVKQYMDEIVQEAKHDGYVMTLMNRRRYLPDITSRNFNQRSFAERTAMNTPIQGSAADIIKKAMIDLDDVLKNEKLQARILLQVHDELILEAPQEELNVLKNLVVKTMEQTVDLSVPLKVDYTYGKNWFEAD